MDFYVAEARKAGGPVVELGVGTGRIAVPIALARRPRDRRRLLEGMLDVCRRAAEEAGVGELVDLRRATCAARRSRSASPLVTCPFRAFLHLESDEERLEALGAVRGLLVPGGRFVFDVFAPSRDDIVETHGRWIEREPGIWERADWDSVARVLTLDRARRGRRDGDVPRLALAGGVARTCSSEPASKIDRLLRLVRPAAVRRRRGLGLDRPPTDGLG